MRTRRGGCILSDVTFAALAGGDQKRPDFEKLFKGVGDMSLIERTMVLGSKLCSDVLIVSDMKAHFKNLGFKVVCERADGCGPLVGIESALIHAYHPWVIVVAADMPNLEMSMFMELAQARSENYGAVAFRHNDLIDPLCAMYHISLTDMITAMLEEGESDPRAIFDRADSMILDWAGDEDRFIKVRGKPVKVCHRSV